MSDIAIQTAFKEGMVEIFQTMFTASLKFKMIDHTPVTGTVTNFYKEAPTKKYLTEITMCGRIVPVVQQGKEPMQTLQLKPQIVVPSKELDDHNVLYSSYEDLEKLKGGVFTYGDISYVVDEACPSTLVADAWLTVVFNCTMEKPSSLKTG
jgi:hypothetical protein